MKFLQRKKKPKKKVNDEVRESLIFALSIGVTIEDFFKMTPWQFGLAVEGFFIKSERDIKHDKWKIWHAGILPKLKEYPNIYEFLGEEKPVQKVDEHATIAWLKAYSKRYKKEVNNGSGS